MYRCSTMRGYPGRMYVPGEAQAAGYNPYNGAYGG